MRACRSFLESLDLPPGDLHGLPDSPKRFADGARHRVEIPSCEGPRCLEALLETSTRLDVRSMLIADIGLLDVFAEARRRGFLPEDMRAKVSAMLPVSNPATARTLMALGADTLKLGARGLALVRTAG
jgi:hypothetical protein